MNAPKTKSQKCCFCEKPVARTELWPKGVPNFSKKGKDRVACPPCAGNYVYRRDNWGKGIVTVASAIDIDKLTESAQQNSLFTSDESAHVISSIEEATDKHGHLLRIGQFEFKVTGPGAGLKARLRLQDNLESCACTHKAKRHVDDGQGNLLHCQDCDCDHFYYAIPQCRNTDLVVLSACEISGEATVVDKLRVMAEDERTNANERIAAAKRMVAILEKQAA